MITGSIFHSSHTAKIWKPHQCKRKWCYFWLINSDKLAVYTTNKQNMILQISGLDEKSLSNLNSFKVVPVFSF